MSTRLNLASKPFRNRVLPWTVTALVAIVDCGALVHRAIDIQNIYDHRRDAARRDRIEKDP